MGVFKMAWRNVWRNKRRTLVTVAAMGLALFSMIVYSSLMAGYLQVIKRNILDLEMGNIQIHAEDYRNMPSLYKRIGDPEALLKKLDDAGYLATARVLGSGLAAAGESSSGVFFRGVNPKRDAKVSQVAIHVAQGSWLSPSDPTGVVIGRRLARSLAVSPGDEIVVLSQGADGSMANELYKVRGILKSIGVGVDSGGIFVLETTLRELLVLPEDAVHQIIIRTPKKMPLPAAAAEVTSIAKGEEVRTWKELSPTLASMLDSVGGMQYIMFLIVYVAIGVVILNAMLMAVFERIREFGVMKALGVGPVGVLRLIILESSIQTFLAIILGGIISVPVCWYLTVYGMDIGEMSLYGIAWDSTWRVLVTPESIAGPVVVLLFIVFFSILYPAFKAALIRPVSAIHHQ